MKKIILNDITLREAMSSQANSLSFKETIEIARTLDKLKVDVIGLAPVANAKIDSLLVHTIAAAVKNSVLSMPAGTTEESVEIAWNAVSGAVHPRLYIEAPVSAVQMEFMSHKKPETLLKAVETLVGKAKALCGDVEFAVLDATRADIEFLAKVIKTAVKAGATTVTVCDSAGTMFPSEFKAFIEGIYEKAPELKDAALSVRCSDELSMAAACTIAAFEAGAAGADVTADGGAAPSVETVMQIIKSRGDDLGISSGVKTTEIHRGVKQILWVTRPKSVKEETPFDTGIAAAPKNVVLDAHDDITAVGKAVKKLGYDLSDEDLAKVFESFTAVAAKKTVGTKELEAIIASSAMQVPPTYKLASYVINCGSGISATSVIHVTKDGRDVQGMAAGDGPIDASFLAIEQITGHHYELDDFQIQAVTEGREAMGSTLIKLRSNGKLYSGNGISTDILGASISSYLNALNKIAFEETHQ